MPSRTGLHSAGCAAADTRDSSSPKRKTNKHTTDTNTMKTLTLLATAALLAITLSNCKSTCSSCQKGAQAQQGGYR